MYNGYVEHENGLNNTIGHNIDSNHMNMNILRLCGLIANTSGD